MLDISVPAVKARESEEYSPNTAWELGYSGYGINIAIIDGGVDDGHPSLVGKFVAGADFTGPTGAATPKDGSFNPDDKMGHGTAVAGVALGTGGNEGNYMGVAPGARLIDIKATNGVTSQIMNALEWCLDHQYYDWNNNGEDDYDGIDIISISLGGDEDSDGTSILSQLLNQISDSGIVIVSAVGNNGPNNQGIGEVSCADKVITVGNLDDQNTVDRSDDDIHPSSSVGPRREDGDDNPYDELKPDVVAPGTNIWAPDFNLVGQDGRGYQSTTGSSDSCPHVSGICALMLEANPDLRPRDIQKILHQTAEAMGEPSEPELSDKYNYAYGYGSVDAYAAVDLALEGIENNPPVLTSLEASTPYIDPGGQVYISSSASDPDGDDLIYSYEVTGGQILGTGADVIWEAPYELGEYTITAQVSDGALYSERDSITITVEEEHFNHEPVIDNVLVDPVTIEPGESSTINVTASDPDGDDLFYEYKPSGGTIMGSGAKVVWKAPQSNGKYTIQIMVSDGELSANDEAVIYVEGGPENQPPEIESFTASISRVEVSGTVRLMVNARDPENGPLIYSYFTGSGKILGSGSSVD